MTRKEVIEKMATASLLAQQTDPHCTRLAELVDGLAAIGLVKFDEPPPASNINHWLKPGAFVPINENTVAELIREIVRLRAQ